jgi:cellulose biosynthesis protein BcsQ
MPKSTTDSQPPQSAIHLSLQGKGGVGKSLIASILAQYFVENSRKVECIDTDPVNQTFSQYRALAARHIELMRDGKIDQRGFDGLMERLLTEDGVFVIDNGASKFIPLWSYFLENNVPELLRAVGKTSTFTPSSRVGRLSQIR